LIVRIYRKIGSLLIAFGMLMWFIAGACFTVHAEDNADGSLQLICKSEDVILSGMKWNLFRVAEREGGDIVLVDEFSDYKISFKDTSADAMSDIASTLETYVRIDKIPPLQTGISDDRGIVDFTNLEQGFYFLWAKDFKIKETKTTYSPVPFMVEIAQEEDGTNQNYITYPKFFHFGVLDQSDADYTVKKIWRNSKSQLFDDSIEITVEMYKDDEYQNTVILSKENDWSYTWTDKAHSDWMVKEVNIPEDYTVIYRSNETQYAIVNTYKDYNPEVDEPTNPTDTADSTQATGSTDSTTSTSEKITTKPDSPYVPPVGGNNNNPPSSGKLPQTGQLWWPVPFMFGGGIILIAIGFCIRSRSKSA